MRALRSLGTALVVLATLGGAAAIAVAQPPPPPASPSGPTAPVPPPPPATGQPPAPTPPPSPPFEPVLFDPPAAPAEPVAPAPPPPPASVTPAAPLPAPPAPAVPSPQPPADQTTVGVGAPAQALPPPRSDQDPLPPVPAPALATTGVTQQAGIGGTQAYGRSGVLEMGGSAGFGAASNYTRIDVAPSLGLFVLDNFQLSLLTGFSYFRVGATETAEGSSATEWKAIFEPSLHLPFSQASFGFLGLGGGINYLSGHKAGFTLQPRIGANFLVGRSGIFTPAAFFSYSTVEAIQTEVGAVLALRSSYGMTMGYTVMW